MSDQTSQPHSNLFTAAEKSELKAPTRVSAGLRANDLGGKTWTKNSISIWSDIRKDQEELSLGHPAIFPKTLVNRLLESFTREDQKVVLDPFSGSGSAPLAAMLRGKHGIGFEINSDYVGLTATRKAALTEHLFAESASIGSIDIFQRDAREIPSILLQNSVDVCITSPPYWDILTQRRSADNKDVRNYGNDKDDLGLISSYEDFLDELLAVFAGVYVVLKPKAYCLVNVMDIRKGATFYPFHSDLANKLQAIGFKWDDLLIWDRRTEYNNMRPLGYPAVFRINKAHEFILVMQKPSL